MSKDQEHKEDWVAPAPRASTTETLRTKAERLVRLHAITFHTANGKRCIHVDEPLPDADYRVIAEAMRKNLI